MSNESNLSGPVDTLFWDCDRTPKAKSSVLEKLHRTLTDLRRRYGPDQFMADSDGAEQMLEQFHALFFPPGRPMDYLASRLSGNVFMLRPDGVLPSHCAAWPGGRVLAARGHIEVRTKTFWLTQLVWMHNHSARPFERPLKAIAIRGTGRTQEAAASVMAGDWIGSLPPIFKSTNAALAEWSAYLEWKKALAQTGICGVRYVGRTLTSDGIWQFIAVLDDNARATATERILKKGELSAYALEYSETPWTFKPVQTKQRPQRGVALGDLKKLELLDIDKLPQMQELADEALPAPQVYQISYAMKVEDKERFDAIVQDSDEKQALAAFADKMPEQGFLATNADGDLALIRRQQEELTQLRDNSGLAPFISAYLFDIANATVPEHRVEIAQDQWLRADMNDVQKDAVRLMVSTTELSLIQGPPGSGKTTMIAEAIYQFVRQGKKVLLTSQANMAVDNALERLGNVSSIRAIRLGAKADKDSPFSEANAAANHWMAVATQCRTRYLDQWSDDELQQSALTQRIEALQLLCGDLQDIGARLALGREREVLALTAIGAADDELGAAQNQAQELTVAQQLFDSVDAISVSWTGSLPSNLRAPLHQAVREAKNKLAGAGLHLAHPLGHLDPMAAAAQSLDLLHCLRDLATWTGHLPFMHNEADRLRRMGTGPLVAPETERLLAGLKHQKAELVERFSAGDDTPELTEEIRRITREIGQLRTSGGLERRRYEQLFAIGTLQHIFSDTATPISVAGMLEKGIATVLAIQTAVEDAINSAQHQLSEDIAGLPDVDAIVVRIGEHKSKLSAWQSALRSDLEHGADRLARLNRYLDTAVTLERAPVECDLLLKAEQQQLDALQRSMSESADLRKDWKSVMEEWTRDLAAWPRGLNQSDATDGYLADIYRNSCNVVGVTCNEKRRTMEEAGHHSFDVAIIDEVSKATPPELLMSMSIARATILVGDHRQLPPLFKEGISAQEFLDNQEEQAEQEDAADANKPPTLLSAANLEKYANMVSASLFKKHFEEAPDGLKAFLYVQYRMHPQIMNVVNAFYENRLKCGLTDPDGLDPGSRAQDTRLHGLRLLSPDGLPYLEPDQHVLWLDSGRMPDGRQAFETAATNGGKENHTEAALIAKLLIDINAGCAAQGYGSSNKPKKAVGVVTFYARQIRAIKSAYQLAEQTWGNFGAIRVDVNTADNYQGQERPIVIVSLVRNPPHKLSKRANTAQFERINVAFSRAQELLLIVGADQVFRNYPVKLPNLDRPGHTEKQVYRQILTEIELNGGFKRPAQIMEQTMYDTLAPASGARVGNGRPHAKAAASGRRAGTGKGVHA